MCLLPVPNFPWGGPRGNLFPFQVSDKTCVFHLTTSFKIPLFVDVYPPVTILGTVNYWGFFRGLDIHCIFREIPISKVLVMSDHVTLPLPT